mmetsp:Transcript_64585/g.154100  ORF Transcript_64585/g.154100 Transcript_64585/m.154100 type:complete len:301 (+) Transcript_64585:54-956(+)
MSGKKAKGGVKSVPNGKTRACSEPSMWRTILVYIMAILFLPLTGIPAILAVPILWPFVGLNKAQRATWRCACVFFKVILWASGCPYTVVGLENLKPEEAYFFAANHESLWDVPLIFAACPFWLISVAKKSLSYVPIFGWAVAAGGTVFVDRRNTKKAVESMGVACESLKKRPRSVLVFPEGTRTPTGEMREFKKGGFVLAIQAGIPVVPVCVCGTYEVVVKGGRKVAPRPLKVIFGKPIKTSALTYEDREILGEQVRKEVAAMQADYRKGGNAKDNVKVEPFWHCFTFAAECDKPYWGRL